MISIFRAPDKESGVLLPLVIVALGGDDIILTTDTSTPTPAVGLTVEGARTAAVTLLSLADEIEKEIQFGSNSR